jgi:hypothetical protein
MINRKIIYIVITLLVLTLSTYFAFRFITSSKESASSKSIQKVVIDSKFATSNDLIMCQNNENSKVCIETILNRTKTGISLQLQFIGVPENSKINTFLNNSKEALNKGDLQGAADNIQKAIETSSAIVNGYVSKTRQDAEKIYALLVPKVTASLSNYYIEGNWAVVGLSAAGIDPANMLLKRVDNKWVLISGPGTFFEPGTATSAGAPKIIEDHLQNIYSDTVVEYIGLTSANGSGGLSSLINGEDKRDISAMPLYNSLPFVANNYSIRLEYFENKPYYIVTVDYSDEAEKATFRGYALKWLEDNGVDPKSPNIKFEYLEISTNE